MPHLVVLGHKYGIKSLRLVAGSREETEVNSVKCSYCCQGYILNVISTDQAICPNLVDYHLDFLSHVALMQLDYFTSTGDYMYFRQQENGSFRYREIITWYRKTSNIRHLWFCCGSITSIRLFRAVSGRSQGNAFQFFYPFMWPFMIIRGYGDIFFIRGYSPSQYPNR